MTSFTSRYGNPAVDFRGAHIWGYRRHGSTVVAVSGRVDARNVGEVTTYVTRFVLADTPFVLDLGAVTAFTPRAAGLLEAVDARCATVGVDWALVAGDIVAQRMRGSVGSETLPMSDTVAEAEHQFDEAVLKRRRLLLPLLRKTA